MNKKVFAGMALLAMTTSLAAFADSLKCSDATGTLRYSYARPDLGNQPPPQNPSNEHWYKNGKTLPGDAYDFDRTADIDVSLSDGTVQIERVYVTHAVVDSSIVPMLCKHVQRLVP